jgi:FkbM family methyltransferase
MTYSPFKFLPNGQKVLRNDSHISRWAEQHGNVVCDPHLFRSLIGPLLDRIQPECIWDIGAFVGDHTAFYVTKAKTVVAFEPNPDSFDCLVHNCPSAWAINMGASDSEDTLRFTRLDNAGASRIHPSGEIEIRTCIPDNMDLPVPQFVKIDAEGWEMHVLRGMKWTLREHLPAVFIEINQGALAANGSKWEDIVAFMEDAGYTKKTIWPAKADWNDLQYDVLFEE